MSQYQNEVNLIGYVGNDADTATTEGGVVRTRLSLATKSFWQNEQQQWQSRTEWHDVVAWAGTATIAAQFKKGAVFLGFV